MAGRRLQTALCRSTVSQQSVTHERDNGNVSAPENAASGVSCRLNSPSVFEITSIVPVPGGIVPVPGARSSACFSGGIYFTKLCERLLPLGNSSCSRWNYRSPEPRLTLQRVK